MGSRQISRDSKPIPNKPSLEEKLNHSWTTKFRKFLKPGGRLYVTLPNAQSINRRLGVEVDIDDDVYRLNENGRALGDRRQYCLDTLRAKLTWHRYSISHREGIYLPLPLGVLKTLPDFVVNLRAMLQVGIEFPQLCIVLLLETNA